TTVLQSSTHTGSKSISSVPYLVWPAAIGVSTPPARIIAGASKETSLRTDRLSHSRRRMSLFLQTLVLSGIYSTLANQVFTGVLYEQDRNYFARTRAAGRPIFPGSQNRWFPLLQRTGRPRSVHWQGGRSVHCTLNGAR